MTCSNLEWWHSNQGVYECELLVSYCYSSSWWAGRISLDKEWTVLLSRRAVIPVWYFHRFLWTHSEQFYPHSYVFLLRTVCVSVDAQVSVVEEIPHPGSTGMSSLPSALLQVKFLNIRIGWERSQPPSLPRGQRLCRRWQRRPSSLKTSMTRKPCMLKHPLCV